MRKSDIVIYEKDSIDLTFELEGTNELITNFEADDKIVFALRMFNSGPAILLKEQTGVTGTQVTFSLDKHDTFRLRPQRYVYDIMVLKGTTQQTTVCKSAYFTVADKQVPIKDKAVITMDALAQYNLLKNAVQGYANEASASALAANTSADRAEEAKTSVELTVASATSEINQRVQTVKQAETNVLEAVEGFDNRVNEAVDDIIAQEVTSINNVLEAENKASLNAKEINETARRVSESEANVIRLREETRIDAIDAHENEEAAKRYAQQAYDISKEIVESTEQLREAAAQVEPRIEQLGAIADELTEAAQTVSESVIEANQAVEESKENAAQALANKNLAETYASTATAQAGLATTKANEASASAINANTSATNASTYATTAREQASIATTKATEAGASANNASTSATNANAYATNAKASADNAAANASASATQAELAKTSADNAKASEDNAKGYADQAQAVKSELSDVAYSGDYNDLENKPELATVAFSGKYSDLTGLPDLSGAGSGGNVYELQKVDFTASDWTEVSGKYRLGTSVKDIIDVYALVGESYQKTFVEVHRDTTATLYSPAPFSGFYQYGTNLTGVTDKNGRDIVDTYATKDEVNAKANSADVVKKSGDTMSGMLQFAKSGTSISNSSDNTYMIIKGGNTVGGQIQLNGINAGWRPGEALLVGDNGTKTSYISINADGTTSAPTPATTDNSTKIATTAWVRNALNEQVTVNNNIVSVIFSKVGLQKIAYIRQFNSAYGVPPKNVNIELCSLPQGYEQANSYASYGLKNVIANDRLYDIQVKNNKLYVTCNSDMTTGAALMATLIYI